MEKAPQAKIYKTLVSVHEEGVGSKIMIADTIEYKGEKWIVPEWLSQGEGWQKPVRIIRMIGKLFAPAPAGYGADFLLSDPVPKGVFDGLGPPESEAEFVVVEAPDIQFVVPKTVH